MASEPRAAPDMRRRIVPRCAALVAIALIAVSCFEPPVAETLLLEFLPDGLMTLTARVRIRDLEESNPALRRRIEEARREALEGTDAWSRRFEALGPVIERGEWEKHEGRLVSLSRSATTDDPGALSRFFADTGLAVDWRSADGRHELILYPPPSGPASRAERQRVAQALAKWSEDVSAYLGHAAALWRHLETDPDRARPALARLFSEYLPAEEVEATGELTPEESRLVENLTEAMSTVTDVLVVPRDEAYSIDELSRRIYDPFPAPIEVRVPGGILEVEGFTLAAGGDSRLLAGGASLWQALRGIEGRWLGPDPVLALVEHDLRRAGDQPFPLADFLGRRRTMESPPSAAAVRRAIEERLSAPDSYRVTWTYPSIPTANIRSRS